MDKCPICENFITASVANTTINVAGIDDINVSVAFPVYRCDHCDMSFRDGESEDIIDDAVKQARQAKQ